MSLKVTVKTTQQKVFQIDADPTDTIGSIKAKIEATQSHPVASQKVIYAGKILADDKTLEGVQFKEKDFLVLMVSKPKPTPSPMPPSTSTPATQAPAPAPAPASETPSSSTPAPASDSAPATAPAAPSAPPPAFGDTSSFLSGEALQTTINNMVDMGFPRDQVLRALRASFNNPDRAVEYLMTGIPAHLEAESAPAPRSPAAQQPAPASGNTPAQPAQSAPAPAAVPPANQPQNLFQLAQQQQQQQQQGANPTSGASLGGAGGAGLDLSALAELPQMQQIRDLIAQNPASLQLVMQQLAQQNPQLAQLLASNPELLMQLLGGGGDEDGEGAPPGTQVISVSPEERAAIERLEALGFPRQRVIEAYFACDKNEELAANYLFENGFEDD
ncbi:UV excision repair protein rad23 [Stygiomarasmius scandens]|uniref:UV excision repair protein RAD23 n=1 Tax=Marasmiellus scandens TaxID=2682957 RepID=A0ABR1K7D7_9AGAR